MEPRLRSPVYRDKNNTQFQVIKASAFDETTTSIKEAGTYFTLFLLHPSNFVVV